MPDDLTNQLRDRLIRLMELTQQDAEALRTFPDGKAVFRELFDSLQSTLQNVDKARADEPD